MFEKKRNHVTDGNKNIILRQGQNPAAMSAISDVYNQLTKCYTNLLRDLLRFNFNPTHKTMSLFEDPDYEWRETYFVFTDKKHRPSQHDVKHGLRRSMPSLKIRLERKSIDGGLDFLSVVSDESHSGIDIIWSAGEFLGAELDALAIELEKTASPRDLQQIKKIKHATAKIEIMHFGHIIKGTPTENSPNPQQTENGGYRQGNADGVFWKPFALDDESNDSEEHKKRFQFDVNRYIEPPTPMVPPIGEDTAVHIFSESDSAIMTPDSLIFVLELIRRMTNGIAVDPASGTLL
ncbi:MAG: hypothetical protein LBU65_06405 [Planctomycetaceae bacterium]|jgi:hypothetical protein|nr:hypothetical protein [Planctomycetaceae bacterium]